MADSSVVNVSMFGFDARYETKGLQIRGQYVFANLLNTKEYNLFTGSDLGSVMSGYYVEIAYEILQHLRKNGKTELYPFVRYENYNTHTKVIGMSENDAYNRTEITSGIYFQIK